MKIFSTESPIYKFITRLWDIIQISVFWVVTSLPIVTMGASSVALATVGLQMANDEEGYVARTYFKAFAANLKKGIPMGLLNLLAAAAVYLDFRLFNELENNPIVFLIAGIASAFFLFMCFIYVYPLLARYENGFFQTIKNSYRISMRFFGRTLLVALLVAVETVLFLWNYTLMAVGLLVGPGLVMFTICWFANRFFKELEKENKS